METKIGTNSCTAIEKLNGKKYFKYCIAIPAYKEDLTIAEKISLKRLHDVVKHKDNVYVFCPFNLDLTEYKKIFPELQARQFDPENFTSIDAYSHLCMKHSFYHAFSDFEYMVIYQLDCYLVKDEIEEWCYKGYDYIGAPILVPHSDWQNFSVDNEGHIMNFKPSVGNGGFSLRNIDTFIELTNPDGELRKRYEITDEKLKNVKYEDVYFCVELNKLYDISKPNWNDAMKFAIDMNPDLAYDRFNMQGLPMCIHAFDKNIPYWRKTISELSGDDLYDFCCEKHSNFINEYYLNRK